MRPQVGTIVADKYRVERVLGEGGMGVVVAARHVQLEQLVALKFLLPEVAARPDVVERFLREARAAARVQGMHAARVLDVGQDSQGMPYMVMEYLEGEDLDQMLARETKLPAAEAVYCILQACEGLAEAHASRIVHRDLKPANLFLAKQPGGQVVLKVLDFGISKEINSKSHALTQTAAVMGTPYYMSPEQMRSSKNVDERSDVWALGVILYELVSGKLPFAADSLTEVVALILQNEPDDIRTLVPGIAEGLAQAIETCLRTDREERFADVGALATAIAAYTDAGDADDLARRAVSILENTPVLEGAPRSSLMQASRARKATASAMATLAVPSSQQGGNPTQAAEARAQQHSATWLLWVGVVAVVASAAFALTRWARQDASASSALAPVAPPPPAAEIAPSSEGPTSGPASALLPAAPQLPDAQSAVAAARPAPAPRTPKAAVSPAPVPATTPPEAPPRPAGGLKGAGSVL